MSVSVSVSEPGVSVNVTSDLSCLETKMAVIPAGVSVSNSSYLSMSRTKEEISVSETGDFSFTRTETWVNASDISDQRQTGGAELRSYRQQVHVSPMCAPLEAFWHGEMKQLASDTHPLTSCRPCPALSSENEQCSPAPSCILIPPRRRRPVLDIVGSFVEISQKTPDDTKRGSAFSFARP